MSKLDIFLFSDNCLNYNFEPAKDEMKNNNSEAERMKAKFEKQLMSLRDEKAKIQQSLSEARIRNEQIEELKKTIEIDQKEKNELGRQVLECKNRL
jgi:predicted RNase H-like nuclease (RuvC/YqgF family)